MMGRVMALVGIFALTVVGPAPAQESEGTSGIHGSVLDGDTGRPLDAVTVTLDVLPGGILSRDATGAAGSLAISRTAVTGSDGTYGFTGLTPGSYRLRIVRLGYRPETLEIHYDAPADPRISVGLEVNPIELEPLEAESGNAGILESAGSISSFSTMDRVHRARARQIRFLQSDAQELFREDVRESMTLGEPDLLRTLQRLPGVVADDDWSAEPWTRGGRWDETRIFFDGLPLYDPTHGGGAFTSVNPDLVGSMVFHPGVRPAGAEAASAGLVELNTRPTLGDTRLSALGQASLLSGRLALERPLGGRSGVSFAARRTYIDELTQGESLPEDRFPYRFSDLGGRWDQGIGEHFLLTISGVHTEDRLLGDVPHGLKGGRGSWGNTLLRGTLQMDRWGLRMRLTEGDAEYEARVDAVGFDPDRSDLEDAVTARTTRNFVDTHVTSLTVAPLAEGGEPPSWEAGWHQVKTRINYDGAAPWPFPGSATEGSLRHESDDVTEALWGSVRQAVHPDVELTAGLRLELRNPRPRPDGDLLFAPRIGASWTPTPDLRVSAGLGRHYQYEQAVAGSGFALSPGLVPTHLWLSAGSGVPAIRADLATAGAELWLNEVWLASANVYHRRSTGHVVPSPDSGFVRATPTVSGDALGTDWTTAEASATGIEMGVRRFAGRWVGSAWYGLSRARRKADGTSYRPLGDRTHTLDLSTIVQVTAKTRLGGTFTYASGAPYTRFFSFRCPEDQHCPPPEAGAPPIIGFREAAGAARADSYASVDLHLEREGRLFGLPFGFFLQLRNALGRDNRSAYRGSILTCSGGLVDCRAEDRFEDGAPRLPLFGFWIRM